MRVRLVVALLTVGVAVGVACAPPEALPLTFFFTARPRAVADTGEQAVLNVSVADSANAPRTGTVTLTAAAGAFAAGGKQATVELDDAGRGSTSWACDVGQDPGCAGNVRLEARWELGADFLVQVLRMAVGPPDGGTDGGAGDGGVSDGGLPISFDEGGMLLLGTLQEGACYRDALADPAAPTQVLMGFPCYTSDPVLSAGALYYRDGQAQKILRFVRDLPARATFGTGYVYPLAPEQNDVEVPTSGCTAVSNFSFTPDGKLFHTCFGTTGRFLDGQLVGYPASASILALGVGGSALLRTGSTVSVGELDGGLTPIDAGTAGWTMVARSDPQGFKLARLVPAPVALYLVQRDGAVTMTGTYADPAAGANYSVLTRIAGDGALWTFGSDGTQSDTVVRVPLAPGTSTVVYTEANAPADNWSVSPPRLYVKIHISDLVTGP